MLKFLRRRGDRKRHPPHPHHKNHTHKNHNHRQLPLQKPPPSPSSSSSSCAPLKNHKASGFLNETASVPVQARTAPVKKVLTDGSSSLDTQSSGAAAAAVASSVAAGASPAAAAAAAVILREQREREKAREREQEREREKEEKERTREREQRGEREKERIPPTRKTKDTRRRRIIVGKENKGTRNGAGAAKNEHHGGKLDRFARTARFNKERKGTDDSAISATSIWSRRRQQRAAAKAAAAEAKKAKKARGVKHQPRVLRQSVTSDRRKSVKVVTKPPPSPHHPDQQHKRNQANHALPQKAPSSTASHKQQTAKQQSSSTSQSHLSPNSSSKRSPESGPATSPNQQTWPHLDLAVALQRGDLHAADVAVRRIAAVASRDDAARNKMVSEGVSKLLIEVLKSERSTLDMRRNATLSIADLTVLEKNESKLVAAGVVPVLIWMLNPRNGSDHYILASSARALRNLLSGAESTAVQAARYGCVEPLLAIVSGRSGHSNYVDIIAEAAAAIANLAHHGSRFQSYIIKHGGLEALTTLGKTTANEEAMFHVVNVFAEFARENRWHRPIVSTGGLKCAFRALAMSKDLEVVAEAARIVGNVSITSKARSSVRESGGVAVLSRRLTCCPSFTELIPAFDLVRALSNVCLDPRAASDALSSSLSTLQSLLRAYTAPDAPDQIVTTAGRCLAILAQKSSNRRAKVLHAIGSHVRQAGLAGKPTKSLYDLRGLIIKEAEGEAMMNAPNTLERLSRASMRLMYSGAVGNRAADASDSMSTQRGKVGRQEEGAELKRHVNALKLTGNKDRSRFKSTGRVLSVTRKEKRTSPVVQNREQQQHDKQQKQEDEEEEEMPRASEEALPSPEELRKRQLNAVTDGGMTKDIFEIGQVLGRGGYGTVMLAKNLLTNELVAIKQFHNSGSMVDKKAIKEQRIWKGLHHKNVVEYKGSFVGDNGTLCLVVEYVDGLSLAEHLSQYPAFPETLVAEISRQVLNGLEYLHANGVTHRDLKPANILVTNSAVVKICDFGVSASENVQTINPGQHMVGTPWYIAPEMVEYRPWTHSLDIWSLGCTVLELATGRRPYHELSAMQVLFRMVEDRRPPIPETLSAECQDFLKSCWMWDPEQRPSATDLKQHPFILKARQLESETKS